MRQEHAQSADDRSGVSFFACQIDGRWQGGWFRVVDGKLEVRANCSRRTAEFENPGLLTDLLRKLLCEIVEDSSRQGGEPPQQQGLASAHLQSSNAAFIFRPDSPPQREQ